MNIEKIRELNPDIKFYTTEDSEFSEYGVAINSIDTDEIIRIAEKIEYPESGSLYLPSVDELEALPTASEIKDLCFGTLDTQIGYCFGKSSFLNALEWHTNSEINIAVTDLVLFLAK